MCRMPRSWLSRNAERMGLAQLHQLRAASAAGSMRAPARFLYRSLCPPLARERLAVMRDTNDGFVVARPRPRAQGAG